MAMADQREGAPGDTRPAANDDKGPERYPSARRDDAVENPSFQPPPGAGAKQDGFEGPQGDPAEGKR
jgi:hypothetical protein